MIKILSCSWILFHAIHLASSFSAHQQTFVQPSTHLPQYYLQNKSWSLYAKKQKTKPKRSGTGFGAAPKSKSQTIQTRTVSGHTGSGTKPLREAANTFDALRKAYGPESCHDLYVRSPSNDETLFWFVGKISRCTDSSKLKGTILPTPNEAVICQKRLILEYASLQLRPQNLGGPYKNNLEIWTAPGDSEMDAVQNKVSLEKVTGSAKEIRDGFSMKDVGFNPEIYVGDEIDKGGLRIVRDEEGKPVKPVFSINDGVDA